MAATITGSGMAQFLVDQTPTFDKEILKDIRPLDSSWMGHVPMGAFPSYADVTQVLDRFTNVWPDHRARWLAMSKENCDPNTCNPETNEIGHGSTRVTYSLERQEWKTQMFCYDQLMTITEAREHIGYILSDVLKPASTAIMSNLFRKRLLTMARTKMLANATLQEVGCDWVTLNNGELGLKVTNPDGTALGAAVSTLITSKLTSGMLQRRYHRQCLLGALGKNPQEQGAMLQLVTGLEDAWEINRDTGIIETSTPTSVNSRWRYNDLADGSKYFKYGWMGTLGNFGVRVDLMPLRFTTVAGEDDTLQVVPPYLNEENTKYDYSDGNTKGAGLGSQPNPSYEIAGIQASYIHHRESVQALVFDPTPVNSQMPFASRDFAGQWKFAIDNLGVPNYKKNQGFFFAEFLLALKPRYVEWLEVFLHQREPAAIAIVAATDNSAGMVTDPTTYGSANEGCDGAERVLTFTCYLSSTNTISILPNGIACNGSLIANAAIESIAVTDPSATADWNAALDDLVTKIALDTAAANLGTWSVEETLTAGTGGTLTLTTTTCSKVGISFDRT